MVDRLLITTPIEDTWSEGEPVVFLGEWCRLYDRRSRWSKLDAKMLPYHWDDRARLESDYRYLSRLQEQLLAELTTRLNEIHKVDNSIRYWRILIGPWLGYFTAIIYDRWESIQEATRGHGIMRTNVLTGSEDDQVPQDMTDFQRLFLGDDWNHHIYSVILRRHTSIPCVPVPRRPGPAPVASRSGFQRVARRGRRLAVASALRIASLFRRNRDAFLTRTYLPLKDEIALQLRLGQVPQLSRTAEVVRGGLDWSRRRWTLSEQGTTDFERAIRRLIPEQIPVAYLEGYRALTAQARDLPWPARPRVIWTSNAHIGDDIFKAWTAEHVEQGAPLVIGQHGGHFGVGRWSFEEDHELAICDRYLSWGWTTPGESKVFPVGQLKRKRPLGVHHASQSSALLVTCVLPRYSYWMFSAVVAGQYLEYLEDQYAFMEALPERVRQKIVVRLNAGEGGWSQGARMRDRLPGAQFDDGSAPIGDLIRESRLYISTYNATTFLESFSMNVPTVIYWNPKHWELRDRAIPFFEDLQRVGVFHTTPESAARHVAEIWDDVDGWWTSAPVREAVKRFTASFANLPDDLLDRVESALNDVARRSPSEHEHVATT